MSNYANGDTGSDRAYDYEREVRDAAIDAKNEWIRENAPFETEEEADEAYEDARREWAEETCREEDRYAWRFDLDPEFGSAYDRGEPVYNREGYFRG